MEHCDDDAGMAAALTDRDALADLRETAQRVLEHIARREDEDAMREQHAAVRHEMEE